MGLFGLAYLELTKFLEIVHKKLKRAFSPKKLTNGSFRFLIASPRRVNDFTQRVFVENVS